MKGTNEHIIKILKKTGALKFGDFTLASGEKSNYYIDLRVIPNFPDEFKKIIGYVIAYIKTKCLKFDGVVAIPLAGMPFGIMIAHQFHKPFYIMRKKPKDHGLRHLIEGEIKPGQKILLVDDLISSGFSKSYAINALREEGAHLEDLFVIIDRTYSNLSDFEKEYKIKVHYLITVDDILFQISHDVR
ncbi:MAG: orotate phosphoribosyltransferase [Candidatus Thorarchaeota archaeon]